VATVPVSPETAVCAPGAWAVALATGLVKVGSVTTGVLVSGVGELTGRVGNGGLGSCGASVGRGSAGAGGAAVGAGATPDVRALDSVGEDADGASVGVPVGNGVPVGAGLAVALGTAAAAGPEPEGAALAAALGDGGSEASADAAALDGAAGP